MDDLTSHPLTITITIPRSWSVMRLCKALRAVGLVLSYTGRDAYHLSEIPDATMRNLQGLIDEYESARLAVAALADALISATRFETPGIRRALVEAETAMADLSIELMDALNAQLEEAA